ncbi:MAG: hypothetical protein JOY91_13555 [Sinobacteraceae bacterium]|nr:hypothetical protein [Nevskiaceae bacterium]
MKTFDSMTRAIVLARGIPKRWLRDELGACGVSIPLTPGCIAELVREADLTVRSGDGADERRYVERLRATLITQAEFIRRWTASDDKLEESGEQSQQSLVRIARQHALPRHWKVSEPEVKEYRRQRPSYLQWTDDLDTATASR